MKPTLFTDKLGPGIMGNADARVAFGTQMYMTKRGPLEGNRIFLTYAHMNAYITDHLTNSGAIADETTTSSEIVRSAIPGILLAVVNDEDASKNGLYYIENADVTVNPGLRAKRIDDFSIEVITEAQINALFDETW